MGFAWPLRVSPEVLAGSRWTRLHSWTEDEWTGGDRGRALILGCSRPAGADG